MLDLLAISNELLPSLSMIEMDDGGPVMTLLSALVRNTVKSSLFSSMLSSIIVMVTQRVWLRSSD